MHSNSFVEFDMDTGHPCMVISNGMYNHLGEHHKAYCMHIYWNVHTYKSIIIQCNIVCHIWTLGKILIGDILFVDRRSTHATTRSVSMHSYLSYDIYHVDTGETVVAAIKFDTFQLVTMRSVAHAGAIYQMVIILFPTYFLAPIHGKSMLIVVLPVNLFVIVITDFIQHLGL